MRSALDRLADIRSAIHDIRDFTGGAQTPSAMAAALADRKTADAVLLALIRIGEAVKALPNEILARNPHVDWRGPAALRDFIAHRYFGVDSVRIGNIVLQQVPELLAVVEAELARPGTLDDA